MQDSDDRRVPDPARSEGRISLFNDAGMERDDETGFYHTLNRYYSPKLGSWMTPDPAGLAAADLTNPQSLNRYSYSFNNPINFIDPLGLDAGCIDVAGVRQSSSGDSASDGPSASDSPGEEQEEDWPCWMTGGVGGGGGGISCDDEGCRIPCDPSITWAPGVCAGGIGGGIGIGGGGGGGVSGGGANPATPGKPSPPLSEQLPPGVVIRPPGLWSLFLPIQDGCEFGPCVPWGDSFVGGSSSGRGCAVFLGGLTTGCKPGAIYQLSLFAGFLRRTGVARTAQGRHCIQPTCSAKHTTYAMQTSV